MYEYLIARHPDDREVRGVRESLMHEKHRLHPHSMVQHIKTDHDGAWDHDTADWQEQICAPKAEGGSAL